MCFVDLEPCEVWEERHRKARKVHRCSCCGRAISPGERYLVHFSVFQGDPTSEKCCAACEADRQKFADAHGGTLCTPGWLPNMLRSCIGEDPDSEETWAPMLKSIRSRARGEASPEGEPGA